MFDLWDSSTGLLKRFNLTPDTDACMRKFFEEVREFSQKVDIIEGIHLCECEAQEGSYHEVCKEATDVMVTMINVMHSLGIDYDTFKNFYDYTIDKNDAKDMYTHEVRNKMIVRKGERGTVTAPSKQLLSQENDAEFGTD